MYISNAESSYETQISNAKQSSLQHWIFPAIMRSCRWDSDLKLGQVQLCTQEYDWQCTTFSNHMSDFIFRDEVTGHATIIQSVDQAGEPIFVMVNFKYDDSLKAIYLAHPTFCPIAGVVEQTRVLIQGIQDASLKRFVENAFSLDSVSAKFWSCHASLRDHHAYAGGLAQHSLEVATMLASGNLATDDKDIGIAFALLHDVGKIHSYANNTLTDLALRIGHEEIGLQILEPLITELDNTNPIIGNTMRELFNGEWRFKKKGRRPLAIGRVVNAFDQLSCERNLQKPIINKTYDCYHRDDVPFYEIE